MSAHELELVRSQQREQLLREDGPEVQRRYPRVPLGRRRDVPRRSIDLARSVVVVGRLYREFSVRGRGYAHHRVSLSGLASERPQRRIENIEREDSALEEVSPRGREQRREVLCSAEVKKRVPCDEYHREALPQAEVPHVAFDEFDVHACCSRSTAGSLEHLGRVVEPDDSPPVAYDRHEQLSAAARKFEDGTTVERCQLVVELHVLPRSRKERVVKFRIFVQHVAPSCPSAQRTRR